MPPDSEKKSTRQKGDVLPRSFYCRDPAEVAVSLLGQLLVRIYKGQRLSGFIVETEAYYGPEDPASRAAKGGGLARIMAGNAGLALVYGIHRQWLLNVVAHPEKGIGAVLIRAIHPIEGVEIMRKLRNIGDVKLLTSGPGRLTRALAIDKRFHGKPLYLKDGMLRIERYLEVESGRIASSHRIGVSKDLPQPLRFYVKDDLYVSRP